MQRLDKVFTVQWLGDGSEHTLKWGIQNEVMRADGLGIFATRELAESWVAKQTGIDSIQWADFNDGTVSIARCERKFSTKTIYQYIVICEHEINYDTNVS